MKELIELQGGELTANDLDDFNFLDFTLGRKTYTTKHLNPLKTDCDFRLVGNLIYEIKDKNGHEPYKLHGCGWCNETGHRLFFLKNDGWGVSKSRKENTTPEPDTTTPNRTKIDTEYEENTLLLTIRIEGSSEYKNKQFTAILKSALEGNKR